MDAPHHASPALSAVALAGTSHSASPCATTQAARGSWEALGQPGAQRRPPRGGHLAPSPRHLCRPAPCPPPPRARGLGSPLPEREFTSSRGCPPTSRWGHPASPGMRAGPGRWPRAGAGARPARGHRTKAPRTAPAVRTVVLGPGAVRLSPGRCEQRSEPVPRFARRPPAPATCATVGRPPAVRGAGCGCVEGRGLSVSPAATHLPNGRGVGSRMRSCTHAPVPAPTSRKRPWPLWSGRRWPPAQPER